MIVTAIANCQFYASIYKEIKLKKDEAPEIQKQFEEALPEFYATTLVFAIKAKLYFKPVNGKGTKDLSQEFGMGLLTFATAKLHRYFNDQVRQCSADVDKQQRKLYDLAKMANMKRTSISSPLPYFNL